MTALRQPGLIAIADYLTYRADLGEKRDAYLTISSLRVLLFLESDKPMAMVHRRRSEGGFEIECHSGLEAVIPLPEFESALPLAALCERAVMEG